MRRIAALAVSLVAGLAAVGCSLHAGGNPPYVRGEGVVSGHAALTGIRPWNGRIIDLTLLSNGVAGDVVALEIWPLGEIGVGLVGARLKVLVPDVGIGAIFYKPKPAPWDLFSGAVKDAGDLKDDSEASRLEEDHMAPDE